MSTKYLCDVMHLNMRERLPIYVDTPIECNKGIIYLFPTQMHHVSWIDSIIWSSLQIYKPQPKYPPDGEGLRLEIKQGI